MLSPGVEHGVEYSMLAHAVHKMGDICVRDSKLGSNLILLKNLDVIIEPEVQLQKRTRQVYERVVLAPGLVFRRRQRLELLIVKCRRKGIRRKARRGKARRWKAFVEGSGGRYS